MLTEAVAKMDGVRREEGIVVHACARRKLEAVACGNEDAS